MKKSKDKRFACLIAGAVMTFLFAILCKAFVWLWAAGWWPLVIVYIGFALGLMIFSADMTPMEDDNDL